MSDPTRTEGPEAPAKQETWKQVQSAYQAYEHSEEEAILSRVHASFGDAADEPDKSRVTLWGSSGPQWLWRASLAGFCCLVGAGAWWLQASTSLPIPTTHGRAKMLSQKKRDGAWFVRTAGQRGAVQVTKRWSIQLARHTSLAMEQDRADQWRGTLEHGALSVRVVPNSMRRFHIALHRASVFVKGTKFHLSIGKKWLRVEVTRGRVEVTYPGLATYQLAAHQGIRITIKGEGQERRYKIPRAHAHTWKKRVPWTAAHAPGALLELLSDLLESRQCTLQEYRVFLEAMVDRANRKRSYVRALPLLQALLKRTKQPFSRHNIAFEIAQTCWKTKHQLPGCIGQYQRALRILHNAVPGQRERTHHYLIHALVQARQWRQARREVTRFLRLYPVGKMRREVIRLRGMIKPSQIEK